MTHFSEMVMFESRRQFWELIVVRGAIVVVGWILKAWEKGEWLGVVEDGGRGSERAGRVAR